MRANGETEQRLLQCRCGTRRRSSAPRERAALAWTEAVTEIGRNGVSDALYDEARAQFTEKQLVDLTVAVIRDQRMEPSRHVVSARSGQLQACSRHDCGFR